MPRDDTLVSASLSGFGSSTHVVPQVKALPRHVAIIMDGNGRWGKERRMPRFAGHHQGMQAVRGVIRASLERGIEYLTLFAFSSENWRRPPDEVGLLMKLFASSLKGEVGKLDENGVRLRIVGDLSQFEPKIRKLVSKAETDTCHNTRLHLTIAVNYGGRWDILQALNKLLIERVQGAAASDKRRKSESLSDPRPCDEQEFAQHLAMHFAPEPDLFIRTGGEERISNFMLWQLAYTELYFTPMLWPDFDERALDEAIDSYGRRERRFGRTSAQLSGEQTEKVAADIANEAMLAKSVKTSEPDHANHAT